MKTNSANFWHQNMTRLCAKVETSKQVWYNSYYSEHDQLNKLTMASRLNRRDSTYWFKSTLSWILARNLVIFEWIPEHIFIIKTHNPLQLSYNLYDVIPEVFDGSIAQL